MGENKETGWNLGRQARAAAVVAVLVFALDQASKYYLIDFMAKAGGPVTITPWFNLVMVWNYGVSFGMFAQGSGASRWVLVGLTSAVTLWLIWWLRQPRSPLETLAVGWIIGGALGNITDRLIHGAVADFFDFHVAGMHWPAFNIADTGITLGVVLWLLSGWCAGAVKEKEAKEE